MKKHEFEDAWTTMNFIVDCCFAIDIIVNFFSASYDLNYNIVEDLKSIAKHYIYGWFFLDLGAIIPFDSFTRGKNSDNA